MPAPGPVGGLRVATWNVLHHVHALNWNEGHVEASPDEATRIANVSHFVAREIARGVAVFCLQEVSGDQLASLRAVLESDVAIFEHTYPRVPRVREGRGVSMLRDPSEHLVTVVAAPHARQMTAQTFGTDPGKGFLPVALATNAVIVNTHVSSGKRRDEELVQLAKCATPSESTVIVVGDFNAEASVVAAALGGFAFADLSGQRHSRIARADRQAYTIDHVAVRGGRIESATVLDAEGLSDHNPVTATIVEAPRVISA